MPPPAPAVNDTEVLVSGLPGSGSRVLVVDDLSDMRELIATALRDRGYRVSLAGSGEEALQLCGEARPELILTDWMMPGMSGPELIEALRADQDLRCIPVVLLTAKSDEESKLLGTEIGADAFLGKPFNDQELCATVRNLLALKARERDVETLNRRLREQVLERYLAPEVVEAILAGGEEFKLEPTAQLTTVLFADLVNFTRTTQQLRAPRMARVVNQFLAAMNEVVFAHGGTVDKFIGDAVMVLFGAPCSMEPAEQARRAVSCGLAMQAAMGALRIQWEAEGLQGFKLRVGVHLGPAVVGNFGSERRMEYTAIGATVNLAARLEGVCPPGEVCITGELADYLPEAWIDGLGLFDIKGFDGQRRLFRMVAEKVPPWESGLGLDAPVDSVDGGPLKRGRVQREG